MLNKPEVAWTGHGSGEVMAQEKRIRTGHKPTMAERITQKGRIPSHYLLPIDNPQVKADIQSRPIEGGEEITFTLTPDTADVFRSELGLAYLLKSEIDRVQWWGQGPKFAKTVFKGWQPGDAPVSATFRFYYIKGDVMPAIVKRYFAPAASVPAPFRPFLTQYDTYLLRYKDIVE